MKIVAIMYDLYTETSKQRKANTQFRKWIIRHGFMMLTESVYIRYIFNEKNITQLKKTISSKLHCAGIVQWLVLTQSQFEQIEYLKGNVNKNIELQSRRYIQIGD